MYNRFMFSYLTVNVGRGEIGHVLGTQKGIDYYDAKYKIEQSIEEEYPEDEGWVLKNLLVNDNAMEYC